MIERFDRAPARLALVLVAVAVLVLPGCHRKRNREVLENEVLYGRAQRQIEQRRFQKAIETLGDVGLAAPVSDELDPKVKLALADAFFFQNTAVSIVEAQSRYEQFLGFYPTHASSPYARYMIGMCLMEQAEDPENDQEFSLKALAHFRAMAAELPEGSPWGTAARTMLARAQDRLAEHEWLIAQFYLGKSEWKGAIGRLSTLVDQYPGSRRRGPALLDMARAHRESGDSGAARASLERLLVDYPAGPLAERAKAMLGQLAPEGPAPGAAPAAAPGAAGSE